MLDVMRMKYALWVVIVGILAVVFVSVFAMTRWTTATDVAAVISAGAAVIGTIVGGYFGVQAGAAGKEKAEELRDRAQEQVRVLLGSTSSELYDKVRRDHPTLF
jgi:hypothetical protein